MKPLLVKTFTATSCIGTGVAAILQSLLEQRSGLASCEFETVDIDTHIGEVAGIDDVRLPQNLHKYECRNNRLAELALQQDGMFEAVQQAEAQMEELSRSPVPDEAALFTQIDRVAQARAELEKANTHLLLQLRGEMDAEQIKKLEKSR